MSAEVITEDDLASIAKINRLLESRFGLRIHPGTVEHWREVMEHYDSKRRLFLATTSESAALADPDYAKAVLISEGVRQVLKEVKPKRRRKRKH
jgi:hypothetical protein